MTKYGLSPRVFVSTVHFSANLLQDFFRVNGERAEMEKKIHPHLLRHTRATHLVQDDVPIEIIKEVLGHDSIQSTQIYTHMAFKKVQNKIDMIDNQEQEEIEVIEEIEEIETTQEVEENENLGDLEYIKSLAV